MAFAVPSLWLRWCTVGAADDFSEDLSARMEAINKS